MAWIELHQTLPTNKKLLRMKLLLGIKTPQAIGHLCMIWLWALDNAPDGDLSRYDNREIAEVAEWRKKPDEFVSALLESGLLDEDRRIHDWYSYAGKLVEKRRTDAIRKQETRRTAAIIPGDIQRTSNGHPTDIQQTDAGNPTDGAGNRTYTVPNSTNITLEPPIVPLAGDGGVQKTRFLTFWDAYPRKIGKQSALKAWNKIKPDADLCAKILDAISRADLSEQWKKDNGRYIPYPTTWLNRGGWEDEYHMTAGNNGSYNLDEFIEAAVRRSKEDYERTAK